MSKAIPANQFAVVFNKEHKSIISSGTYEDCVTTARVMNENYQTDAYEAKLWEDRSVKETDVEPTEFFYSGASKR